MTIAGDQIPMPFSKAGDKTNDRNWLGLAIDHWRLFDALQDGWLRPLRVKTGVLIGIGAYGVELDTRASEHRIAVRVKLDPTKLPALDAAIYRGQQWVRSPTRGLGSSDIALYWPGVLPTFAISELQVSTEEERARLTGLAKSVSNVELPASPVKVGACREQQFEPSVEPPEVVSGLIVPGHEDAMHGALCMAVWGVPRIDPWMDLLVASLTTDRLQLRDLAASVDAPWWRHPPWARHGDNPKPSGLQEGFWLAALEVLRSQVRGDRTSPYELADRIALAATRLRTSTDLSPISAWVERTHRILRAESVVRVDGWRKCPVGLAIQLVLTRPEPSTFKGWFRDLPNLPPAVGWSAATLCGLLQGYRTLDTQFRGTETQRELLSIHALRLAWSAGPTVDWPSVTTGQPQWRKEGGEYVLSWGGREFARKREKPRGKWFAANLEDPTVVHDALLVSRKLQWSCIHRQVDVRDGRLDLAGSGNVVLVESPRRLDIQGKVMIDLPRDAEVVETLDFGEFRRLVATESGSVPAPPDSQLPKIQIESPDVPGLTYVPDFLSAGEENELVETIDRSEWQAGTIRRRVQHYGWRYDYGSRKIDTSMRLGPLPEWASRLARRLVATKLLNEMPDQLIVNEYIKTQGIHKHIDRVPSFADGIVMISLLESWEMVFRNPRDKRKVCQLLERRSAAVMKGDSRYLWTHEIPRRKFERGNLRRERRISLTFRKVLVPEDRRQVEQAT